MLKAIVQKLFAFLLNVIDRVLYHLVKLLYGVEKFPADLSGRFDHLKQQTVEVDDANYKPGIETKPRRRAEYENELISTPIKGIDTLTGLLDHLVQQHGDKEMLGHRPFKRKIVQQVDGKDWEVFEFGDVQYQTYSEIYQRIVNLGRGIARLTGLNSKDIFGIFEETRKEWLMTLHACMRYNITVMTVYATLGDEALIDAINECELTAMLVNETSLKKLAHQICPKTPSLKYLVYCSGWDVPKQDTQKYIQELDKKGVKVLSIEEVEELGKNDVEPVKVKEPQTNSSLAVIMYTSGTTGAPKGM